MHIGELKLPKVDAEGNRDLHQSELTVFLTLQLHKYVPCIYATIAALIQHETKRIHAFTQKLNSFRVVHSLSKLFQLLGPPQTRNVGSCLCAYFLGKAVRNRTARNSFVTPTP